MMTRLMSRAFMAAGLLMALYPADGAAQTWQGQVCWQLDGYSDRIRTGLLLMPDG